MCSLATENCILSILDLLLFLDVNEEIGSISVNEYESWERTLGLWYIGMNIGTEHSRREFHSRTQ